ncbi:MAG: hypothetical protein RMJ56_17585 [Gemmataceae bacterium]|nr:hypothetical protein [Gemmata sp.]MDW8199410.1 hypothetical protein [Gemmataceae bacterium]
MQATLSEARSLVAAIAACFQAGNPADELMTRLGGLLATLRIATLPPELERQLQELSHGVEQALAAGQHWLAQASAQLAHQQLRQRAQRAYGRTEVLGVDTDGGFNPQSDDSSSPAGAGCEP